jgi:multicomponent Na+:H+ antiporter subunit F
MPGSHTYLLIPALILLLTMVTGLLRALMGPSLQDRMLSVLLLGTGGVGLLLLLAYALAQPALIDVALVLALLAAMTAAALTRRENSDD